MRNVTTALLNSTTTLNSGLRLTELERRYGRLMRSPDGHDAGADAGAPAADAGSADAGASDAGAGSSDAGSADAGGAGDDATLLGSAATGDGAGDATGDDSKTTPTPTPVPDDAGVPEAYELKALTIGEGDAAQTIEIDSSLLESVTPGLKEAGVTQSQLDKLAPLVPSIQEAALKQMNDEFSATRADWAKQTKEDPEIGGKNWPETERLSAKALDHFGAKSEIVEGKETNEFRKLLNDSGLGNHPVMLRMFRDIGKAVSEDGTFIRNTSETKVDLPREAKNYPNDTPKTA